MSPGSLAFLWIPRLALFTLVCTVSSGEELVSEPNMLSVWMMDRKRSRGDINHQAFLSLGFVLLELCQLSAYLPFYLPSSSASRPHSLLAGDARTHSAFGGTKSEQHYMRYEICQKLGGVFVLFCFVRSVWFSQVERVRSLIVCS